VINWVPPGTLGGTPYTIPARGEVHTGLSSQGNYNYSEVARKEVGGVCMHPSHLEKQK
jgi:hypothetical protein